MRSHKSLGGERAAIGRELGNCALSASVSASGAMGTVTARGHTVFPEGLTGDECGADAVEAAEAADALDEDAGAVVGVAGVAGL